MWASHMIFCCRVDNRRFIYPPSDYIAVLAVIPASPLFTCGIRIGSLPESQGQWLLPNLNVGVVPRGLFALLHGLLVGQPAHLMTLKYFKFWFHLIIPLCGVRFCRCALSDIPASVSLITWLADRSVDVRLLALEVETGHDGVGNVHMVPLLW